MVSCKKWSIALLITTSCLMTGLGALIVVVDPFFHYHAPLDNLEYPLRNQRYQNDGIVKHFEYDAIITGSSLTENFKTSEFDELFEVNSIKVPLVGASYKEVNNNLERAVEANSDIRIILRGLDGNGLLKEKDSMNYDENSYPEYLYDKQWFNDVKYVFSMDALLNTEYTLRFTKEGNLTTTFDSYSNWMALRNFGKVAVDESYERPEKSEIIQKCSNEDYELLYENLMQNVVNLATENPQIHFIYFFPPYSIYHWDSLNQEGTLIKQLQVEKRAIEILLQYPNIYLYSFFDEFDMICNLELYCDSRHYNEDVNSQMLLWISQDKHRLTKENYQDYCDKVYNFYTTYDYDALFEES